MAICSIECWCEPTEAAEGDVVTCGMYIKSVQAGGVHGLWGYASYNLIAFSPEINQTFWDVPEGEKRLVGLSSFTMPNKDVSVRFTGKYIGSDDKWYECATKTITVKFKAGTGSIYATSAPSGAKVYLEGVYKGISPLTISNVPIGQRWVKFIKAGYVDKVVFVTVEAGKTVTAHADLEPPAPEKCDQDFRVTDKVGNPLDAYVKVGSLVSRTYSDGECIIIGLTKGSSYTAKASKSGYICLDCTKTFTACTSKITLKLTTEAPPEKKDTMICDSLRRSQPEIVDGEDNKVVKLLVGTKYTLRCWLYEKDVLHFICLAHGDAITDGQLIKFVRTDTGATIKTANTTTYGYAGVPWTPIANDIGEYNIKAVYGGNGYNPSESGELSIEVKSKPDKGVIVVVREDHIPDEKLKVQVGEYALGRCCYTPVVCAVDEAEVDPDNNTVTFELTGIEWKLTKRVCVRTLNQAGEVMDEVKNCVIEPPSTQHLKGWLGRPYRSWISVEPTHPGLGEGFVLKAHLRSVYTDIPLGEGVEVTFFRITDTTPEEIGTGLTNEYGVAPKSWSETLDEGVSSKTFKYEAEYDPIGKKTYPEPATVIVTVTKPTCPIDISSLEECPIMKALQGTVVFTHLDTLRWYRDTKMSPLLVNTYYRLIPITGRIARYSRISRLIVRAISTISIRGIERKYGHSIPCLRYQQNVKL